MRSIYVPKMERWVNLISKNENMSITFKFAKNLALDVSYAVIIILAVYRMNKYNKN
jgi:hypothetical protein